MPATRCLPNTQRAVTMLANHPAGLASHAARYLHALCCLKLGKLNEAREVLTKFGELEVGLRCMSACLWTSGISMSCSGGRQETA
eukprot:scaffold4810_cov22-Tisochrysis_lutea.AAC.1